MNKKVRLTAIEVQKIWDGMPGEFMKNFGYHHFALAVEDWVHKNNAMPDQNDRLDAERYRFLRDPLIVENFPPADGACWVVEYRHSKGSIPELRSAGFGRKLDATIDLAIEVKP